jgi:sulfur carrier protein ThiS|tara:strand:- start:2811 stop:3128 length:318 start_codon:yes stop_codon:yes gene_type:complete
VDDAINCCGSLRSLFHSYHHRGQLLKLLCINNDGAGFADYVDVEESTTVRRFFEEHIANPNPSDYLIRVNRQPVAHDQVLCDGDRISITPTKIEGAGGRFIEASR